MYPPGISKDGQENLTIELTEEEKQEVRKVFHDVEDVYYEQVGKDGDLAVANEAFQGLTSLGLFNYAKGQVGLSEISSDHNKKEKFIDKAFAAISKSYILCPLPIYKYDLACFVEMTGKNTTGLFEEFLKSQKTFKPTPLQDWLLMAQFRDIDEAIKDAESKI